ncbi:transmembrane protein, putative [Medicago truncatula]|uniref:Transmembrane protein, putative n=1 Tax=Medicago truncatula TaxID=3880 RepID=G7LBQ2_MEDTR|nr:transmembrane protein, putative [Medicago truncatula]
MIFIHSNREITSFDTAKNVKDETANKLTASKLIAYNGIMPTKIYDKIKAIEFVAIATNSFLTVNYAVASSFGKSVKMSHHNGL